MENPHSQAPVEDPVPTNFLPEAEISHFVWSCTTADAEATSSQPDDNLRYPFIDDTHDIAANNDNYRQLCEAVIARLSARVRVNLIFDNGLDLFGSQAVISSAFRCKVLHSLRDSHCGVEATKSRAWQIVCWPGSTSNIMSTVKSLWWMSISSFTIS